MTPMTVTNHNFNAEVAECSQLVLVDFWASWCGPCRAMAPIVDELAIERDDIKVCKIDVDENPVASTTYGIMSIPCFMIFKGGQVVAQRVGSTGKDQMIEFIEGGIA